MKLKPVLACLLLLIACLAEGATIEYMPSELFPQTSNLNIKDLVLSGEIKTGDAKKLLAMLLDPKSPGGVGLTVNSPGGSVAEAIKIAKLVKSLYMDVRVKSSGHCASACFFIFLAGSGRTALSAEYMDPAARRNRDAGLRKLSFEVVDAGFVGLHRPYLTRIDSLNNKQSDAMRAVATYLEGELLSRRLIDLMMSKPSNDIHWLTQDDLDEIGEYPPEQEEYLIRKCGYDRNRILKVSEAKNQGDRRRLAEQLTTSMKCTFDATSEARETTMLKLKSGWRPY